MQDYLKGLNDQQREAVLHLDGPLMIVAGAGSGKTKVLTTRIAHLMSKGVDAFNILALTFTNKDGREVEAFVTAAAARGATGIGAGVDYMGPRTLHIGFGTSPSDHGELTWGKNGQSANAPAWLRKAAQKGWDNPAADADEGALAPRAAGRFTVISRDGLNLRKGPGLGFGITKILETGTEVTVRGFDGPDGEWARVDLEDDGLVDGHVLAAFLAHADRGEDSSEDVEEPD